MNFGRKLQLPNGFWTGCQRTNWPGSRIANRCRWAQLALHIATVPGALARISQLDEFDAAQANFNPPVPKDVEEIHAALEESVRAAEECVGGMSEQKAKGNWRLMVNGKQVFNRPRVEVLRSIMLNHWYHHRGQLSVYLALARCAGASDLWAQCG